MFFEIQNQIFLVVGLDRQHLKKGIIDQDGFLVYDAPSPFNGWDNARFAGRFLAHLLKKDADSVTIADEKRVGYRYLICDGRPGTRPSHGQISLMYEASKRFCVVTNGPSPQRREFCLTL